MGGHLVRSPRAPIVARHLFEGYVAVLLGTVIGAVWIPAMISARETARRAMCTNNLRQHSGFHADAVTLNHGNIVDVCSCWACGVQPNVPIDFINVNDEETVRSLQTLNDGIAVLSEARERLWQYKRDFCRDGSALFAGASVQ
jgi:hypothetical protein